MVWLATVLVFCAAAYGEERYRTEIAAEYLRTDIGSDLKISVYGPLAEVFFQPVKTDDHSYAEAAFFERIGSVGVGVAKMDVEMFGVDGDGLMIIAGLTLAKPGFPLVFQAEYSTVDADFDAVDGTLESNAYELRVGNYFAGNLVAGIEYGYDKTDMEAPGFTSTSKDTSFGLFAKYVHELGQGAELALEGALGQSKSDDGTESLTNTDIALSADYYFNRSLSAGAGIETSSGDNELDEGNTYTARVRYFITPRFSAAASYDKFVAGNEGADDEKSLDLVIAARF